MIVLLFALLVVGIPIAFSIGLSVLCVLTITDVPLMIFAQRASNAADSFALLAIPLFILAGELMNRGGLTVRLVGFAHSLIGHLRGGLGQTSVLSSLIFANVSGSAVADTTAVGSVMVPSMMRKGYRPAFAASLQASAGLLAPIVPPSILLILYGSMVNVSIGGLFLGALIPGYLIALGLMVSVHVMTGPRYQPGIEREPFAGFKAIRTASREAIPALGMPVIIIAGIAGGVFTATEAGAVAVMYALNRIAFVVASSIVIAFVLILGTVMEVLAIATIFGPLLHTLAITYGLDPIFFGVLLAILMQIGGITPPVGILLNITCGMAGTKPGQCLGYIGVFVAVICAVVVLAIVFPSLITFLPGVFM